MDLNKQIIEEAKGWVGIKFQHRSTTKFGCDCTGLIIGILKALGFGKNYELRNYPYDWNLHGMADDHIVKVVEKVSNKVIGKKKPGDIVLFEQGKCTSHIGIVLENDMFLHALRKNRKSIISKLVNSKWSKRVVNYYRFDVEKLKRYE